MNRYHFIGICGISMSALAFYLCKNNNYVQGSDICNNEIKNKLKNIGVKVFDNHSKNNISNVDIVVFNNAISENNVELLEAKKQGIKIMSRAELLAKVLSEYNNVISVSGSHGKTTTTYMIFSCLKCANLSPSMHIGGLTSESDFGFITGLKNYIVCESCEYKDSFLNWKSKVGVILNVEPEHLDYFGTYNNEVESYKKFAQNCDFVVSYKGNYFKGITFGDNGCDITAKNIRCREGKYSYDCYIGEKYFCKISLGVYGIHNIYNSLACIGTCLHLGIEKQYIINGLKKELIIERRFEKVYEKNGQIVIHDYAHHPTEIKKSIQTFNTIKSGKILVVFQPHTYSRTKTLFDEFVHCFSNIQTLFVKTYPAREKYDKSASAYTLYKAVKKVNKDIFYCANFDCAKRCIKSKIDNGYSVLILGAGDVYELAKMIKVFD